MLFKEAEEAVLSMTHRILLTVPYRAQTRILVYRSNAFNSSTIVNDESQYSYYSDKFILFTAIITL